MILVSIALLSIPLGCLACEIGWEGVRACSGGRIDASQVLLLLVLRLRLLLLSCDPTFRVSEEVVVELEVVGIGHASNF